MTADLWADPDFVRDELEAEGRTAAAVPPPVLKLPPGMKWRAHRDGVGHLLARGATRYLCNRMPIAERYAWPMQTRCGFCVVRIEEGRV